MSTYQVWGIIDHTAKTNGDHDSGRVLQNWITARKVFVVGGLQADPVFDPDRTDEALPPGEEKYIDTVKLVSKRATMTIDVTYRWRDTQLRSVDILYTREIMCRCGNHEENQLDHVPYEWLDDRCADCMLTTA